MKKAFKNLKSRLFLPLVPWENKDKCADIGCLLCQSNSILLSNSSSFPTEVSLLKNISLSKCLDVARYTHHLRTLSMAAITFLMSSLARLRVSARTERPDISECYRYSYWNRVGLAVWLHKSRIARTHTFQSFLTGPTYLHRAQVAAFFFFFSLHFIINFIIVIIIISHWVNDRMAKSSFKDYTCL